MRRRFARLATAAALGLGLVGALLGSREAEAQEPSEPAGDMDEGFAGGPTAEVPFSAVPPATIGDGEVVSGADPAAVGDDKVGIQDGFGYGGATGRQALSE